MTDKYNYIVKRYNHNDIILSKKHFLDQNKAFWDNGRDDIPGKRRKKNLGKRREKVREK
jgi:hypothetical protein